MLTNVRKIQGFTGFQMIKKACFLYTFKTKKKEKYRTRKRRISNTEQGTRNIEAKVVLSSSFTSSFRVPCSVFDIQYFEETIF
jgi:hypothetical protein